jgi:hypothetical protein
MSVPVSAAAATAVSALAVASPLDSIIMYLNSNPYFIGIMMLFMNLGGRFLSLEVTKEQEKFFQHPWVRRCLIFTIFFIGTRNIFVAFVMSFVVILCLGYLFNENSSLCLLKLGAKGSTCDKTTEPTQNQSVQGIQSGIQTAQGVHGSTPVIPSVQGQGQSQVQGLTTEEMEIYSKLHTKYTNSVSNTQMNMNTATTANLSDPDPSEIYWENMNILKGFNPRF